MATALDLITDAMQEIGALALGEVPSSPESQKCLTKLDDMIAAWNTENLSIFTVTPQVFPVNPAKNSYTMGPGGDFNTARPVMIEVANIRDAQGNDYPTAIIDYNAYSQIISKTVKSSIPTSLYYDDGYPLQTLFFWPVASDSSFSFVLWVWQSLATPATLATVIAYPPGYKRALTYNLAMELCPSFGVEPSASLVRLAADSKAALKKINYDVKRLGFDNQLVDRRAYGYYAVLTGQ